MNKHIQVKPVGGSPSTRKVAPGMAGNSGRAEGNHVMGSGRNGNGTITRNDPALHTPAQAPARYGNEMAFTEAAKSGRACVGVGRTAHGPSGSQSTYGASENKQGVINKDRTIEAPGPRNAQGKPLNRNPAPMSPQGGGGPGSFGFRGK
jgi:hypothetical protein